jgi:hypothetical protein
VEALEHHLPNLADLLAALETLRLLNALQRYLVILALEQVVRAVVYTHVTQEPSRQQQRRILHRALLALAREGELCWVWQDVPAEIAIFLFLHDESIFVGLIPRRLILAVVDYARRLLGTLLVKHRNRG